MVKKRKCVTKGASSQNEKKAKPARSDNNKPARDGAKNMDDWISSLAKESTADNKTASKSERIKNREAKRARRQMQQDEAQQSRPDNTAERAQSHQQSQTRETSKKPSRHRIPSVITKRRISRLESMMHQSRKMLHSKTSPRLSDLSVLKKRERKRKVKGWTEATIQPPKNYYGGIGLARKSLFLTFEDPSFFPQLEEEFMEHIPGFFGRQKTKAMKKQLDSGMLWRRLQSQKEGNKNGNNNNNNTSQVNGIRLSDMSPDDRVEAMIKLGIV